MATLQELRAHFGAASDEEAIQKAAARFRIDPVEIAKEVGYDLGGKWGNRLGASVDSYQANMYGLGEAITGSDWMRRGRVENEAAAGLQREIARSQGAISSYKDVDSFGDGLDYLGGLAVDSLPYAGEALLGGFGAARLVGRGLQGAIQAGRAADASVDAVRAGQAAERALALRSTAGGVAASYPSAVGDILSNQREASPDGAVDLLSAAVGGVPYAALNAFGIEGALARRSLARGVGEGGALSRLGKSIGLGMVTEGASETGQEMINQGFGRMAVDPNAGLFDPDALERYGESFVGGAALGGAFSSVGGWRQSQEAVNQQRLQGAADRDWDRERTAIEVAEKQRELDLLGGRTAPNWTTSQGFDPSEPPLTDPRLLVDPRLGDISPQWDTLPGASGATAPAGIPATGLYPSLDDEPVSTGRRRDATGTQIPAVDGVPTSLGNIVADQFGVAATTPGDADALYGEQNGDPGLIEARRRYEEQVRQREEARQRQDEAQRKYEAKRADAFNTFEAMTPEDQKRVRQPAIDALATVRELVDSGRLGVAESDAIVGELRGAVQAGDNKTVNRILKEAKERASQQPVVPGATGAPGGPVAGEGDQPGRSTGAARPVAGSGAAGQPASAPVADTGSTADTAVADAGRVGAAGAPPAELSLPDRINAIAASGPDVPVTVRVKGKEKTITRAQMADKLRKALSNPKHRAILEAALLRVEGRKLGGEEIAAYVTRVTGEPYTKQSVDEFLGGLGLSLDKLDQLGSTGVDTVTEEELGMGAGTEDASYRTAETLGDATSDGVVDEGLTSAQKKLKAEADALLADKRTKAERTQGKLDEALEAEVSLDELNASRARATSNAVGEMLRQLSDPSMRVDLTMARNDWNEMVTDGGPQFDTLPPHVKVLWIQAHRVLRADNADIDAFEREVRDFEEAIADGSIDASAYREASDAVVKIVNAGRGVGDEAGRIGSGSSQAPALGGPVEADPQLVIGDGTRAQGVKIERKPAAPKPTAREKDYSYLGDATVEDDVEVDGAPAKMTLPAAGELRRLDKLEADLELIISCVRGAGK